MSDKAARELWGESGMVKTPEKVLTLAELEKIEGREPKNQWIPHDSSPTYGHCAECGNTVNDLQRHCNLCGTRLKWPKEQA